MIPSSALTRVRADELPPGCIAWIDDFPTPVLVAGSSGQTDDGKNIILLMDLAGEQPFDVWIADQGRERMALVLTDFRLEVDPNISRFPLLSALDFKGFAFIARGASGLVGSMLRSTGESKEPTSLTLAGAVLRITHDSGALAFPQWRLVHGEGGDAFVIYEHRADGSLGEKAAA
jgi:hypothetical protein